MQSKEQIGVKETWINSKKQTSNATAGMVGNVPSISSKRQNSIDVVRRTRIIAKNLLLPIAENP